ncbi:hypothetical protein LINGRAHAP2_LOCUS6141 [Linum grandiflorum]
MWFAALGSTSRECTNLLLPSAVASLLKFIKVKASCMSMK